MMAAGRLREGYKWLKAGLPLILALTTDLEFTEGVNLLNCAILCPTMCGNAEGLGHARNS